MDSGMDAMAKGDVVSEFVELSLDGKGRTGVRRECRAARRSYHGVRDYKIAVEEELQNGNACASHSSVPGGVRGMRGRALRKRLRQKIA